MESQAKSEARAPFMQHANDTGSCEVQIAVLTQRIKDMTEHLKRHKKDKHSMRGLIAMVNRRKKHLRYLSRTKHEKYLEVVKTLGLRH